MAVVTVAGAATNVNSGLKAMTEGDDTPRRIVSFVKEEHTPEWYAQQMALWRRVTEREPKNGEAWLNLYHATRYHIMFTDEQEDYTPLTAVWKTVHETIPDSYADYVLTYFHDKFVGIRDMDESAHERVLQNMVKAIRMQPNKVEAYPEYVACLMMTGDEELMNDILHRWYESGTYSANLLNYAYNEMVGLEPRAVIFTNGDVDTYSKLILQGGKGLFADVQVVCSPMLHSTRYRETICRKLGISLAPPSDAATATAEDYDQWLEKAQLAIIGQTGRPAYFCATAERVPSFSDKLYSEGLVSRYSTRRYDNLAVKQRNYEKRYLLDYLYETFVPETYEASAYRLNLNYIPCLKSLLDWYKQNDKARYKELYGMMMTIIRRTENIPDEKKQLYYDEINR